jgi:ubiquinone/menaquinone biosynthesis C-methylase UbiE
MHPYNDNDPPHDFFLAKFSGRTGTGAVMTAAEQTSTSANVTQIARVYEGHPITIRFLEALGWGGELLNLGWFRANGILNVLNLIPDPKRLAAAQRRLVSKSVGLLAPAAGEKILDVACGRGFASHYIATTFPGTVVTGMDLLPANISSCIQRFPPREGLGFVAGDACRMPFGPGEFNRILCLEAAFHFPDRAQFLSEARRVLQRGGTMLLVDFMWKEREHGAVSGHPLTKVVKNTWAWDDFSSVSSYLEMIANSGFEPVARHDWTRQVTASLQWQFNVVARLAQSKGGRRLLVQTNPALEIFKPSEWQELQTAARAHDFVNSHSRYMAMVVRKK